jgi:RNA polymerase sigma factor (sigma-70 family)
MAPTTSVRSPARGRENHRVTSNTRLVCRAQAGDEAAWNELIDRFSRMVWAVARSHRLGAADAADVFQTTWLRLVENVGGLNDPERVEAWLATTARRECLRLMRGARRQIPAGDGLPEPVADLPEPDARLLRDERDASLWQAFARLRPGDQALLRMLSADPPPSYREVAVALDIPIGSIGPTRGRCLARLRRQHERIAGGPPR